MQVGKTSVRGRHPFDAFGIAMRWEVSVTTPQFLRGTGLPCYATSSVACRSAGYHPSTLPSFCWNRRHRPSHLRGDLR